MPNELLVDYAPKYTIDASSLIDIFGDETMVSRNVIPGLWEKIEQLMRQGTIISHVEVLYELKKDGTRGGALYDWAQQNRAFFKDYDWIHEGAVIRTMSLKYSAFVDAHKVSNIHADPWLIAQAKRGDMKIITEEKLSASPDIKKHKIPNVCVDPAFGVGCVNLLGFIKENGWRFQ